MVEERVIEVGGGWEAGKEVTETVEGVLRWERSLWGWHWSGCCCLNASTASSMRLHHLRGVLRRDTTSWGTHDMTSVHQ